MKKCPECGIKWLPNYDDEGCGCGFVKLSYGKTFELTQGDFPVFISADNLTIHTVKPMRGKVFGYKELLILINTDIIQTVELWNGQIMILDEEGKLKNDAIINEYATGFYKINRMTEEEVKKKLSEYETTEGVFTIATLDSDLGFPENSIVGNVVVCNPSFFR